MTSLCVANPGIYCDNCGDPCRPHLIHQCQVCGGYICDPCVSWHLCMARDRKEVRAMLPEYVRYSDEIINASA